MTTDIGSLKQASAAAIRRDIDSVAEPLLTETPIEVADKADNAIALGIGFAGVVLTVVGFGIRCCPPHRW